jgi:hypothetical protein
MTHVTSTPKSRGAYVFVRVAWALAALAVLAALTLGACARLAAAQQVTSTLDVGGASLRYADSVSAAAAVVSPSVRVDWTRATLAASGTASKLGLGDWSTQGALDASVFTPAAGALVGELGGSAGGSVHRDGTRTGQALAVGRAHVMTARAGAWGGAGGGWTWDGGTWRAVRLGEAGAWVHVGAATALAAVTPTAVDDTLRYTDATVAVRFDLARAELGASAGVRSGSRLPSFGGSARSWGSASATVWMTEWMGVAAAAGTYPVDLTQGFPGGRYATLSLRLGSRGHRRSPNGGDWTVAARQRSEGVAALSADTRVLAFETEPARDGRRILRVYAPDASAVEVAGDFTTWQPAALTRGDGGWWTIALPVARGTHQLNLRIDNGAWRVPPGLAAVADEFGGAVGLLVVEP